MASAKKRKAEQEADQVSYPNHNVDGKPHSSVVEYIRQPDDDGGDAASESDADYQEEEEEDVCKLLEPLSVEQITSLLVSAAARDPDTLAEIRSLADLDPAHRKLFVHGLGWETTSDALRSVFARYGELDECRVVVDRATGRSKGYGFVLYRHRSSARRALRNPQKLIDNRMTACQLASAGPTQNPNTYPSSNPNPNAISGDNLPRKIYVGNVHADIDGRRLHTFFSQYGEIEEGPIGFDRHTGKPKGFALFVYRTVEGARKALEEPQKNFEGHLLVCQKATDSNKARGSTAASNNSGVPASAPSNASTNMGGYNASAFGSHVTPSDIGLAQQAAMFGQGLLGQGMPVNAAFLAMLAAAGQNPAAFGITPAMLASLNPSLAGAFGAGVSTAAVPQATMSQQPGALSMQGYGMGSSGYQTVGFQGPSAFQGPPGFQGPPAFQGSATSGGAQQAGSGSGSSYQGGNLGQSAMQRSGMGHMSGYGHH
ncbi:Heterogeneous nuclear ribonucleoprotein 1 [Apostasia shenzhenica]|uniref:Heterogeneous nuclear ribonucleoprotein 1 n=1 Tax=Apostasia shenzhenica TaxID=1088818 RepID=A0A2I0AY52_9ASPA|nr:Heterogeneous nuclear ribonucleoprotein 1 [Apostasia shenzhenica]